MVAPSVAVLLASTVGCEQDMPTENLEAQNETLEDLIEDPEQSYGKRLQIAGEVDEVYGARAFALGGDDFFGDEMLVVTKNPIAQARSRSAAEPIAEDDIVQVSGTLRPMVITEVERELGWDMQPELEAEFTSKPVFVADRVIVSPRADGQPGMARGPKEPGAPQDVGAESGSERERTAGGEAPERGGGVQEPIADVTLVFATIPVDKLFGKQVDMKGLKVQSVAGDRGFWVGPSHGRQMFVRLDPEPKTPDTPIEGEVRVEPGQLLDIRGTVRDLPDREAIAKEWGLPDVQANLVSEEPLYVVAEKVTVQSSGDKAAPGGD